MHLAVLIDQSSRKFFLAPEEVMMAGVVSLLIGALIAGAGRVLGKKKTNGQSYMRWLFLGSGAGLCVLALVLMAFDERPPFH